MITLLFIIHFMALSPAEISGLLASLAAVIGSIIAFIKFGVSERGSLTISQAQGANTILDAALKSLNAELERKDEIIDEIRVERDALRIEVAELRKALEGRPYRIGEP